jgi:hypothetical protein
VYAVRIAKRSKLRLLSSPRPVVQQQMPPLTHKNLSIEKVPPRPTKPMKFAFSLVPMTAAAALLHHGLPASAAAAPGAAEAKLTAPSLLRGGAAASSGPDGGLRAALLELARGSAGAGDAGRNLVVQQQSCWNAASAPNVNQVPCDSLSGCYENASYLADTKADAINEGVSYCGSHLFMTYFNGVHANDDGRPWITNCCSSSD